MSTKSMLLAGSICLAALHAVSPPLLARSPATPGSELIKEQPSANISTFTLANGLEVLVMPDKRGSVVTHILKYKVGAADEQAGETGLSHFFEHLMFKATRNMASGHYSRTIDRLGGQHNASAHQDMTSYYARVAKPHLETVMRMEADRMVNLLVDETEVTKEREVIKEERRMRVDNNPGSRFTEQLLAATYLNHPYRRPVIGWMHEIETLTRASAQAFYEKYYTPQNAVLIVAGDVTVDEVKALAEKTYGAIAPRGIKNLQQRPTEPPQIAARRLVREDPLIANPQFTRIYVMPPLSRATLRDSAAASLLFQVLGSGIKSRIYQKLVVEMKVASGAGASSSLGPRDLAGVSFWSVAAAGQSPEVVERAIDALIAEVKANGITAEELAEAKAESGAALIYQRDSQYSRAFGYGWNHAQGRPVSLVDELDVVEQSITLDEIKAIATKILVAEKSTSGWLLPPAKGATSAALPAPGQSAIK